MRTRRFVEGASVQRGALGYRLAVAAFGFAFVVAFAFAVPCAFAFAVPFAFAFGVRAGWL